MKTIQNILLIACLFLTGTTGFAQYGSFATGPYSGVSGLGVQPAAIVDSRYTIDIMPAGFYLGIAGDYAGNLFSFDPDKYTYSLQENNNLTSYMQLDLLHAMIGITSRQSVGVGFRTRAFGSIGNASEGLLGAIYKNNYASAIPLASFYAQYHTFSELFASYAMMVTPKNAVHSVSLGVAVKLTGGGSSSYMNFTDGTAAYDNAGFRLNNASGQIGRSESDIRYLDFKMGNAFGFGADIGLVYEFRPDILDHEYNMDGESGLIKPYPNKYVIKVSVALTDVGTSVKYPAANNNYNFTGNNTVDIHDLTLENMHERALAGMTTVPAAPDYSVKLPMALNAAIDWNTGNNLYVNFHALVGFSRGAGSAFYRNAYTLTPRYERTWFGVGIPVQIDQYSNVNVGMMLRLGPLWVGSQTLFTNLASNTTKASDVSVMVKIPFLKAVKKDSDRDDVSDAFDLCPNHRGAWGTQGCPDTDGDGIPDEIDLCPYESGLLALQGCPDRDDDGITDAEDNCPDDAGLPEYNGCPDTDEDGIIDKLDDCPLDAGPAETRGCPDTDDDGVLDKDDKCPEQRGVAWNFGCPEGYQLDKIVETITRKQVPLTPDEQKIVNNAFNDVNFETGKATFEPPAPSLDRLSTLLKGHPDWQVIITGHTDNTGFAASKKELSENRAIAGKNYLIQKGISADRIITIGMGDMEPVASNATEEGRRRNRRMVVTIVK
jgi:outer membrane protein OmpA-like peptidoglycan-associated protein